MLEDAATRRAFMDPRYFGEALSWTLAAGGAPTVLHGIWDAPHARALEGQGPGVSILEPSVTVFAADLPTGAAAGDGVTLARGGYVARDLEPDGSGLVRVILERAA